MIFFGWKQKKILESIFDVITWWGGDPTTDHLHLHTASGQEQCNDAKSNQVLPHLGAGCCDRFQDGNPGLGLAVVWRQAGSHASVGTSKACHPGLEKNYVHNKLLQ